MKVFISWSGDRSKAIAEALYDWLPTIIQPLEPWMSEHDIDKGTRGLPAIAQQLEETQFGIICLTHENLNAPWLLFEAGALSKSQDQSRVWTFLYQMEHTDVRGPLAQFQHTKVERGDIRDLLRAINIAQGSSLISDQQLEVAFNRGWQELDQRLQTIPNVGEDQPERSEKDMIKEILELMRAQVNERRQNSYEADRYMASFLPLLLNAAANDPKLENSEMVRTARELQLNALRRLLTRKVSAEADPLYFICDNVFDPASGSSGFLRDSEGAMSGKTSETKINAQEMSSSDVLNKTAKKSAAQHTKKRSPKN
jgi:hypothetical protein